MAVRRVELGDLEIGGRDVGRRDMLDDAAELAEQARRVADDADVIDRIPLGFAHRRPPRATGQSRFF